MRYPRSILQGYSKPIQQMIARALHMTTQKKGGFKVKIPRSILKGKKEDSKETKGKVKRSALKSKKNDNDGDEGGKY